MAVKAWFNYSTYMANKLVQMQETYPDENWTSAKLNAAFEKAGFVGDTGAQAHFLKYGHTEDVSPNKYFDAKYYYESKAIKYYTEQVAESQRMTKDEVLKDLDTYAKNMEGAIKAAGMDAWTHYIKYGTAEGVNPSNSFSTSNYMADKLAALQAADPSAGWTEESMNAAFKKAGLNALEHFMEYAGKSESEVSSTDIATYVVPEDQQIDDGSTTGDTFTLTTGLDAPAMTSADDVVTGVVGGAANVATYTAGDQILDKSTTDNDALNLTLAAANNGGIPIEVANVENINIKDAVDATGQTSTFKALLVTGAKAINADVVQERGTMVIEGVQSTDTAVGLSGKGNLTATYTDLSGSSDTVTVHVSGAGSSATASAIEVDGATANTLEGVNLVTTGDNYFTIAAGTAAKTFTVSGDGNNTISDFSAAATGLTIDASAATGKQAYTLSNFGTGNTVKGGKGTEDELTLELTKTSVLKPAASGFETVVADFTAAGTFSAENLTDTKAVSITGAANAKVTNLTADITTVNVGTDSAYAGTVDLAWVKGATADAKINLGATPATGKASVAAGATTISGLTGAVSIDSVGTNANTLAALTLTGTTGLAIQASGQKLTQTGNITANDAKTISVEATAKDVAVGTIKADETLTELTVKSDAGKATVTAVDIDAAAATNATYTFTAGEKLLDLDGFTLDQTAGTSVNAAFVFESTGDGGVDAENIVVTTANTITSGTISLTASASGEGALDIAKFTVDDQSAKAAIEVTLEGKGGDVILTDLTLTKAGDVTATLNAESSNVTLGTLTETNSGAVSLEITSAADQTVTIGTLAHTTAGTLPNISISGAGKVDLFSTATADTGAAIDVSAKGHTGDLTLDLSANTFTVGVEYTGSDSSTGVIKTGTVADQIDIFGGTNTITAGNGADQITLGGGTNKIVWAAGDSAATSESVADTVTGFTAETDSILFAAKTAVVVDTSNTYASLSAAVTGAGTACDTNGGVWIGESTTSGTWYVLFGTDTNAGADGAIVLTGVTGDLSADNIVTA